MPTSSPAAARDRPPDNTYSSRRLPLAALGVGLVAIFLHLASLGWGFFWDDFFHQAVLRDLVPEADFHKWSLFDFDLSRTAPGHTHAIFRPWWTDGDFKARFFRPVTSLTLWLDHVLFGDWAPGYHVTNLLIFALVVVAAWRLYRALPISPRAALFALALFAWDDVHAVPVGWVANRNSILALLFTLLTVHAARRYLAHPSPVWLAGAVMAQVLAFGSKESGIVAFPLAFAYMMCCGDVHGPAATPQRVARSPLTWMLGAAALLMLVGYIAGGYGARSLMYVSPWDDPLALLLRVLTMLPLGLLSLVLGVPPDLAVLQPWIGPAMLAAAGVIVPLAAWTWLKVVGWSRVATFASAWVVLSLIVEVGGDVSNRLLGSASFGAALLLGLLLDRVLELPRRWRHTPAFALASLVFLTGGVLGPGLAPFLAGGLARFAAGDREVVRSLPLADESTVGVLLNARSGLQAILGTATWRCLHDADRGLLVPLTAGRRELTWLRDSETTMVLTSRSVPLLEAHLERLFRTRRAAPSVGARYDAGLFEAEVLSADDAGLRSVRFRFPFSLDDQRYRFLSYDGETIVQLTPPAVGRSLEISEPPAPFPGAP
ncbi:MAG: hypothetical protein IPM13_11005 [Phycisphaerales bacterium]|nr:hypothetical protein [Phycisphaerales bacterium]